MQHISRASARQPINSVEESEPKPSGTDPSDGCGTSDEHEVQPDHRLDTPLPTASTLQQTLPSLPRDLTTLIFDLAVARGNALSVEKRETLRKWAKPMADLAGVNKAQEEKYGGELAALRWTYRLTGLDSSLKIDVLVDSDTYGPNPLRQAPSCHTLALMVAAGECLPALYLQLHERWAGKDNLAPHMDWGRLPVHAISAGYLMLGPSTLFDRLATEVQLP